MAWALCFGAAFSLALPTLAADPRQGYFMFPINPGQPASLTGCMGELRTNHYHGGLDIRTQYRTGLPVYASAEGFVRRVQVSSHGYGYMVHLQHPNGLVTVYAHLEAFAPAIRALVLAEQRRKEAFEVNIYPTPGAIRVSRGEVIGRSGNSGSSGGPHLHYEIRDTGDVLLNPMHFGFSEIKDRMLPYFAGMALRTLDIESRVEGQFGRVPVGISPSGPGTYRARTPVHVYGTIGLEIQARDRVDNGTSRTGIACLEVRLDGKLVYYHNLERFPLAHTGSINVHIDYATLMQKGERFERCYAYDGNPLAHATGSRRTGRMSLRTPGSHTIEVTVQDAYHNESTLTIPIIVTEQVRHESLMAIESEASPKKQTKSSRATSTISGYKLEIEENTLVLRAPARPRADDSVFIVTGPNRWHLPAFPAPGGRAIYLYDLRRGLPEGIELPGQPAVPLQMVKAIPPGQSINLYTPAGRLHFASTSLYDTCYLTLAGHPADPAGIEVGSPLTPLAGTYTLLAPTAEPGVARLSENRYRAAYLKRQGRTMYLPSRWVGGRLHYESRYLGRVVILSDSTPPSLRVVKATGHEFIATLSDNLSGIKTFRLERQGRFVPVHYDHKLNKLWADTQEWAQTPGQQAVLVAEDQMGNRAQTVVKF